MDREEILKAIKETGLTFTRHGNDYVIVDVSEDEDQEMVGLFPVEITADCGAGLTRKVLVSLVGAFENEEDLASALEYCGEYTGQ